MMAVPAPGAQLMANQAGHSGIVSCARHTIATQGFFGLYVHVGVVFVGHGIIAGVSAVKRQVPRLFCVLGWHSALLWTQLRCF